MPLGFRNWQLFLRVHFLSQHVFQLIKEFGIARTYIFFSFGNAYLVSFSILKMMFVCFHFLIIKMKKKWLALWPRDNCCLLILFPVDANKEIIVLAIKPNILWKKYRRYFFCLLVHLVPPSSAQDLLLTAQGSLLVTLGIRDNAGIEYRLAR